MGSGQTGMPERTSPSSMVWGFLPWEGADAEPAPGAWQGEPPEASHTVRAPDRPGAERGSSVPKPERSATVIPDVHRQHADRRKGTAEQRIAK